MKLLEGIPEILFKYRDWGNEHHRRIILNNEIYFPSMSQFNDPYEGKIPYRYRKEDLTPDNIFVKMLAMAKQEHPNWSDERLHSHAYEHQRRNLLFDESHLESVFHQTIEDIERNFGIFSLTTEENNFLMWSHYSSSHKGFCIGFNTRILFELIKGGIEPVTYERELPTFSLFEHPMMFSHKLLSTKSTVWKHENEFRIIKSGFARMTIKIPPEAVVKLILGCQMEFSTRLKILDFIKVNLKSCEVYETSLNANEFKIDIMKIY